jgi:LytS/YehU family sensor histidine kinase
MIYYKELREERTKSFELEKQLVNNRMNFLKQQLQPHFLFNTHHSIITLMKMGEMKKAVEMMEKLSDLMRFALKENTSQEITLEREIDLLTLYLDIQKVRFEDKLNVTINIASNLYSAFVPSMILQPLVENSIKYAVEKSSGLSHIYIKAGTNGKSLYLTVKDEVAEPFIEKPIHKGIGLNNTEERLQKLYSIHQSLDIQHYNQDGYTGVNVTIKIPLKYA